MDKSLVRFVYLLVAFAAVFIIIIIGIQSSATIINSISHRSIRKYQTV